jgi:LysM repeat protein
MAQSENGRDKDFVLSSSSPNTEELEPGEEAYYQTGRDSSGGRAFRHIYIAIAGFLILIILTVVVIARTYSLAEKAQMLALESRLEQLESRLGSLEGEGGLSQAAGSGSPLILLTERLDQLEANMTARINSVANQLNSSAAIPAPEPTRKAAAAPKTDGAKAAKAAVKESKAKIHTVQKGDTLYSISRSYNLSVDQLRQYNKLDSGASIYPGQKLNITPPK